MANLDLNSTQPISVDDQIEIIQTLFDAGDHAKAIELCDIALKQYPENSPLAILKHTISGHLNGFEPQQDNSKKLQNNKQLIHRIESIANVFSQTKQVSDAITLYKILKQIDPNSFLAFFRLGQCYFDNREYVKAIEEYENANRIDPFHIFTLKKLGLAHYIQGQVLEALNYWMDGLILTIPTNNKENLIFFQTHIRNAQEKIAGFGKVDRNNLFKKRQKRLGSLVSDLKNSLPSEAEAEIQDSLDHWFIEDDPIKKDVTSQAPQAIQKAKSLVELAETTEVLNVPDFQKDPDLKQRKSVEEINEIAEKLKSYTLFKNLSLDERVNIANFTSLINLKEGSYVFHENEPCYGIYFIDKGLIEYSNKEFNLFFTKGQLFGHENILIHEKSMFTAKVKQDSDLVFIDHAGLSLIFSRNKALAVHFLWYFWKSLTHQYQELRYILKQYYSGNAYIKGKIEHLPSIQLSQKQIHALIAVCKRSAFPENTVVFNWDDIPAKMYIVLNGKIKLVHKGIDLYSFVEKGHYFGEVFLTDKDLMSPYQVEVVEKGSKILKIDASTLQCLMDKSEVVQYDFLNVLCKMFAYKLLSLKKMA